MTGNANDESIHITGSFGYRERIALLPGAQAIVTLSDVSRADALSIELDRQVISMDGKSVPVDYNLSVNPEKLKPGMSYAVRAEIRGRDNSLLWTTDTMHLIDVAKGSQQMTPITLIKIPGRNVKNPTTMLYGSWVVHSIDEYPVVEDHLPEIQFNEDGTTNGSTGCNRFVSRYNIKGSALKLKQVAVTKRACIPGLDQQEKFFTEILNEIESFTFDEAGQLMLQTANGRFLKASKQ